MALHYRNIVDIQAQQKAWESIFGWNTASSSLTALNKLLAPWKAWFGKKRSLTEMNDGTSETMFQHYG